jgi:hypothetical protein
MAMGVRIPMTEPTHLNLPTIGITADEYAYMNTIHERHADNLEYRPYKYPTTNRVKYHSKEVPIDVFKDDAEFLTIDNFYQLLPNTIVEKLQNYFTEEFYDLAINQGWHNARLYLNKPNSKGVHIHKDIYHGSALPRRVGMSIPVSPNSLTSDLNFYDDELDLIETTHYQFDTPTVLNTTVFHEVVHSDHTDIRKIITVSTRLDIFEFMDLLDAGKVVA